MRTTIMEVNIKKFNENYIYVDKNFNEEILNIDQIACFILKKLFELYPDKLNER